MSTPRIVEAFLARLKDAGVEPEQVITDGSALYPTVLSKVWSGAAHQLCLFHETRRVTKALLGSDQHGATQPACPAASTRHKDEVDHAAHLRRRATCAILRRSAGISVTVSANTCSLKSIACPSKVTHNERLLANSDFIVRPSKPGFRRSRFRVSNWFLLRRLGWLNQPSQLDATPIALPLGPGPSS